MHINRPGPTVGVRQGFRAETASGTRRDERIELVVLLHFLVSATRWSSPASIVWRARRRTCRTSLAPQICLELGEYAEHVEKRLRLSWINARPAQRRQTTPRMTSPTHLPLSIGDGHGRDLC
jgi:hypothetical protein